MVGYQAGQGGGGLLIDNGKLIIDNELMDNGQWVISY